MENPQRLEAFENMLGAILEDYRKTGERMRALKAEGKEKTATYRQLMGNKLQYEKILSFYKAYGLFEEV